MKQINMKNLIIGTLLLLPLLTMAQETIFERAARETCEYINGEEFKNTSSEELTTKLGVFIIKFYGDNKEEFKKEGYELDFSKGRDAGVEFGEKVGIEMVSYCPEALIKLSESEAFDDEEADEFYITGELNKIEGDEFSTIVILDSDNKRQKFLWLGNFEGSEKLIDYESIKGMSVKVTYKNTECYSPKLKEYIIRKEIVEIEYL